MRAVVAALALALAPAVPAGAGPLRLSAGLGDDARLGATTSIVLSLAVAKGLPPVTEVRLLTPAGIDFATSGLGVATCVRPSDEVREVMNLIHHDMCPANALMGTGSATAELRLDPEEIYDGAAQLAVYAGESIGDHPGLVVVADAYRPIRTQLTYRGYLYVPPPGFGIGMALNVIPIPRPPFGAPVALSRFRLVVGGPWIRYARISHGKRVSYRPRAVPLPSRCPAGGFRFRAIVRLADGRRLADDALVGCPSRQA